ncbi:hypothetical protein PoB_001408200 [Plakobranchus ocellatus]|uniref:Uncharacterized protein n=1 Tax=Plakobranchus ocellatus TaxID=259542 RepID=A0AAV3YZD7_9GAST|nr:hypothetical protein PoB_001408200 [Plakobranchus ocellatus]
MRNNKEVKEEKVALVMVIMMMVEVAVVDIEYFSTNFFVSSRILAPDGEKRNSKRLSECIRNIAQQNNIFNVLCRMGFKTSKLTNVAVTKSKRPKVKRKKGLSASLSGEHSRKSNHRDFVRLDDRHTKPPELWTLVTKDTLNVY